MTKQEKVGAVALALLIGTILSVALPVGMVIAIDVANMVPGFYGLILGGASFCMVFGFIVVVGIIVIAAVSEACERL